MEKRIRRVFTREQKFAMLKNIETFLTVKKGLEKYQLCHSVYQMWKWQLAVGVWPSLRNSKPLKAPDLCPFGDRKQDAEGSRPHPILDQ